MSLELFIPTTIGVAVGVFIMMITPEQHQLIGDIAAGFVFFICLTVGILLEVKKHKKMEVAKP